MNNPSGSSWEEPIKPHMQIIDDLNYKYLFFLTSLDANNMVTMEEEEKRLLAYILTNKKHLFSFDTENKDLQDSTSYTKRLANNVKKNYLKAFVDENIISSFDKLKSSLDDITSSDFQLHYISCVLICSSLLFLIRTTKRSLFMFLSQKHSNGNRNASIVKTVVGVERVDMNIKEKLSHVILYIAEFIKSIQAIVLSEVTRYGKMLEQVKQATQNTEQHRVAFDNLNKAKKYIEADLMEAKKTTESLIRVKTQLESNLNEASRYNNQQKATLESLTRAKTQLESDLKKEREQCALARNTGEMERKNQLLEKRTLEIKTNLSGITQLAKNFNNLFQRWDTNTTDKNTISMKLNALNAIDDDKSMYQSGLDLLSSKVTVGLPSFEGNLKGTNNITINLVNAILQLDKERIFTNPEGLEMFYGGSQIYNKLVLLYEELSGAVRAIVRVRNVYASMKGGSQRLKRKIISNDKYTQSKRRRLQSGGNSGSNSGDDTRFRDYTIQLDKVNRLVKFDGIDENDNVFKSKTLQHGPFFSVHDDELNNKTSKSIEDDLLKGVGFDSLVNMFKAQQEKSKEPAEDAPEIVKL